MPTTRDFCDGHEVLHGFRLSSARVRTCVCSVLALTATTTTPAVAQTSEKASISTDARDTDQDIVVTAQRREQNLQDVPVSVTALSADALLNRNVTDVRDLQGVVAAVSISGQTGANSNGLITVRGITGANVSLGSSPATVVYLDGVYLSRVDAAYFALDDVERIEVLRGPQGTLYGRNATAGAINIVTRTPGETLQFGGRVSYGNYDNVTGMASISGPLGGNFYASFSGAIIHLGGWLTNTVTGDKVGDQTNKSARVKLRYASGSVDATLSADYVQNNFYPSLSSQLYRGGVYVGLDTRRIETDNESINFTHTRSKGVGFVVNVDAADTLKLTSVTGYREEETDLAFDFDGTAVVGNLSHTINSRSSFYQEVRGVLDLKGFLLTFGGNYTRETGSYNQGNGPTPLTTFISNPLSSTRLNAAAGFAQAELHLTDTAYITAGLRLNYEDRSYSVRYPTARKAGVVQDTSIIPAVGINWEPTSDILIYAKVSKGYNGPGFNPVPGATAVPSTVTFGPESLVSYEGGVKTSFLDRRVTLNLAAYYYDYSKLQVRTLLPSGLAFAITNGATATNKGMEAELTIKATPNLTLSGNISYADAKFTSFCEGVSGTSPQLGNPACSTLPLIADRTGNRLPFAPKWTGSGSIDYLVPISATAKLHANASYSYIGQRYWSAANEFINSSQGSVSSIDARLALELSMGLDAYVFGKNLTDKRYPSYVARTSATGALAAISQPRIYGVGLRFRY